MHTNQKAEEETKAQWELDVFSFSIENNIVQPLYTMTNDRGEEIRYPI